MIVEKLRSDTGVLLEVYEQTEKVGIIINDAHPDSTFGLMYNLDVDEAQWLAKKLWAFIDKHTAKNEIMNKRRK